MTMGKDDSDIDKPPVVLARTLAEISAFANSACGNGDEHIILVPIDFSDHSIGALNFAATLTRPLRAALIVLHVIHDPGEMPGYYSRLIEQNDLECIEDVAEQAFRKFMSDVLPTHPESSPLRDCSCLMVVGLPVTRILEVAGELNPLMVVMGSQGRTGLGNLMVGSKAAQIVQLCPFPVTIVKNPEESVDA
jgi:nucleotide-binding universal stress UspA family protein